MDKKRLLIAAIFLVVTILLGYLLYRVFFAKAKPKTTTTEVGQVTPQAPTTFPSASPGAPRTGVTEEGQLPGGVVRPQAGGTGTKIASQKQLIQQKVDVAVKSPSAGAGGGTNFYNAQDGKFYRLNADGSVAALSDKVFFNVDKVNWSPNKNETIIEYPDGSNIYYNFDSKKQVTLPKHWEGFSFSPGGDKIAAKSVTLAPENRWLVTSDPDGANVKLIEPMGQNQDKVTVNWSPNKQIVGFSLTGEAIGANRQEVLLVGLNKENFKSLTVEGRGFEGVWSPGGNKLLHSVYNARNEYKPELWIVDANPSSIGENRRLLNVSTWADKCAMVDERFAYCGVPESLDTGAGFAPSLADNTPDKLFKIDTATGLKTEIALDGLHVIDSIFPSKDGTALYFTDKTQTGIFQIPIK